MKPQLTVFVLLCLTVFVGCASLQQKPAVQVHPSRLACPDAPELVDGNPETPGALQTDGYVEKRFAADFRLGKTVINSREIVGTSRAGALIALKEPSYITYIEIYALSAVTEPLIDVVVEEPKSGQVDFIPIKDRKIGKPIQAGKVQRFRIGQRIRYLRLTAEGIEDTDHTETSVVVKTRTTRIPLKGPTIREVRFYEIPTAEESSN
jgi:hypothetical protein